MRHEMLKRLRTWLRPKRELTPEDVEALDYSGASGNGRSEPCTTRRRGSDETP